MEEKIEVIKSEKRVTIKYSNKRIYIPKEIQSEIDKYWEIRLKQNRKLIRGRVFCILNIEEKKDEFVFNLGYSDYAHYLYTLNNEVQEKYACKVCFAVGLIMTSDDKYIVGQMNADTATPMRLQLPGGGLEEQDFIEGKMNLEKNLSRELLEEVGIDLKNKEVVEYAKLKYIKKGGVGGFVAFVYKIKINITGEKYLLYYNKFSKTVSDELEFCKIILIEKNYESIKAIFSNIAVPVVDYLYPVIMADIKENK